VELVLTDPHNRAAFKIIQQGLGKKMQNIYQNLFWPLFSARIVAFKKSGSSISFMNLQLTYWQTNRLIAEYSQLIIKHNAFQIMVWLLLEKAIDFKSKQGRGKALMGSHANPLCRLPAFYDMIH
jgi:hypothetical protein